MKNPQEILTEEELKLFFAATHEYKVEKISADKYKLYYDGNEYTIIYQPCIQTLIRDIHRLGYNAGYEYDKKKEAK